MESVLKIAVVAVAGAICVVTLKKLTPEIGVVLGILVGITILHLIMPYLKSIKDAMDRITEIANISPALLSPIVKIVGISIITRLASEVCRDTKESGIASFVELSGAVTALVVSVPLMETVLEMVMELL